MARVPEHPAIRRSFTRPPEWRMNPVTGEWVIIAPERSSRPMMVDVREDEPAPADEPCPFCEGNERQTPPELQAFREPGAPPNGPGWRVRAVANSYPAVKALAEAPNRDEGPWRQRPGIGRHELIIECPGHQTNLARFGVERIREVVRLWRERMLDCRRDPALQYAQLFKNHGNSAGASVEHAHSQLIAMRQIPRAVRDKLGFAVSYYEKHGTCCYCELLRREKADGARSILETPGFAVFTAFAGRQPFETWIMPERHHSDFALIEDTEVDKLGSAIWSVLRRLDLVLEGPPFNLVFHTAPIHEPPLPHYHWHLEVLPRLTQLAGFEWGSGSHINPILPEDAAQVLRECAE